MTLEELEAALEDHGWVRLVTTGISTAATPEAERIATEPCGCRVDRPTGLRIWLCPHHEREREEER
jgi:hypothetical protein